MGKNDWVVGDPELSKEYENFEMGMKKDDLIKAFIEMGRLEIVWPEDKSSKEYREKVDKTFAKMVAENKSKGEK